MQWVRKHFWELALNSIAVLIFSLLLFTISQSNLGYFVPRGWGFIPRYSSSNLIGSSFFRDAGDWAIRFLLISLAMSPIFIYFRWKPALRLRKPAGLWAFAFACIHVWLFASDILWGKVWMQDYIRWGLAAFIILALLTLTSHRFAMRLLGKNWKRLHRLVYVAGIVAVLHGLMAASHWSKIQSAELNIWEMRVYCVLMVLLLVLRIPMIKTLLNRPPHKVKRQPEYANNPL